MDELIAFSTGVSFRLSFTPAAYAEFMKADAAYRARCQKWMQFYCDDGHELLDKTKFRFEGKHHSGGKTGLKVSIWAFKAGQLRAYGGVVAGNHFIVTEVDTAKKQDAADQKMLARSAEKLTPYIT